LSFIKRGREREKEKRKLGVLMRDATLDVEIEKTISSV
jgi:hypothetical protein